jgi:hypothetical protein
MFPGTRWSSREDGVVQSLGRVEAWVLGELNHVRKREQPRGLGSVVWKNIFFRQQGGVGQWYPQRGNCQITS